MHQYKLSCGWNRVFGNLPSTSQLMLMHINKLYRTRTYSRLTEDEPSGSKHEEDIVKIKILV